MHIHYSTGKCSNIELVFANRTFWICDKRESHVLYGVSALSNGYRAAQAQQRCAVAGGQHVGNGWDVSLAYSNVQYIPGMGSSFADAAIFNTAGAVLYWQPGGRAWCAAHYKETKRAPEFGRQRTDIHQ